MEYVKKTFTLEEFGQHIQEQINDLNRSVAALKSEKDALLILAGAMLQVFKESDHDLTVKAASMIADTSERENVSEECHEMVDKFLELLSEDTDPLLRFVK